MTHSYRVVIPYASVSVVSVCPSICPSQLTSSYVETRQQTHSYYWTLIGRKDRNSGLYTLLIIIANEFNQFSKDMILALRPRPQLSRTRTQILALRPRYNITDISTDARGYLAKDTVCLHRRASSVILAINKNQCHRNIEYVRLQASWKFKTQIFMLKSHNNNGHWFIPALKSSGIFFAGDSPGKLLA